MIGRLKNYYFPLGSYRVWFRLKGAPASGEAVLGRLEIWDKIRQQPIAERPIAGSEFGDSPRFKEVALPFDLKSFSTLEPRIYTTGRGSLWFDRLSLAFAETWPATTLLEAEDLFHQGELIPDPEASGKEAVRGPGGCSGNDPDPRSLAAVALRGSTGPPAACGSYPGHRFRMPGPRISGVRISSPPGDKILGQEVLSLNRSSSGRPTRNSLFYSNWPKRVRWT